MSIDSVRPALRAIAARDVAAAGIPGHSFRVVADAVSTGGAFSWTEATSPAGAAVGPHVHDTAIECFYVVEGSYRITVSDAVHEIAPGGFALVPRGAPHQFEVTEAGRAVVLFSPAGFEAVFRKMPEIFGTPGEPGPLWQRLNEEFSTRLLPSDQPLPGPPALVIPALVIPALAIPALAIPGQAGTILAGAAATQTGLSIGLRSDLHPGSAWTLPSPVTAVWVVSGGYRFEAPSGSVDIGAGEYAWLRQAAPGRAISLRPRSRALYLELTHAV